MDTITEPTIDVYSPLIKTILVDWWEKLEGEPRLSTELRQLVRDVVYPGSDKQALASSQKSSTSAQISHVRIESLRGIRNLTVDLRKQSNSAPGNLLILGDNGSGKSSFVDALELFFTGQIEKLFHRGDIKLKDCLSFIGDNRPPSIAILFNGFENPLSGVYRDSFERQPAPAGLVDFLQAAGERPFILHRAQLTQFIESRPADRYTSLSNLIGMGKLDGIVDDWKSKTKAQDDQLKAARKKGEDVATQLHDHFNTAAKNKKKITEAEIYQAINQRLQAAGFAMIANRDDLCALQKEIFKRSPQPGNLMQAEKARGLINRIGQTEESITRIGSEVRQLIDTWQAYLDISQKLVDAPFEKIIVDGRRLIEELDLWQCPLCEVEIQDRTRLLARLDVRLGQLAELSRLSQSLGALKISVAQLLHSGDQALNAMSDAFMDCPELPLFKVSQFKDILRELSSQVQTLPGCFDPLLCQEKINALQEFTDRIEPLKLAAQNRIKSLIPNDTEQNLLTLVDFLGRADEKWQSWEREILEVTRKEEISKQYAIVRDSLIQARITGIRTIIEQLDQNFISLYNQLHPGEGHKAITIIMNEGRANSADLIAETEMMKAMHPLGHYSEGHLDSLGLCIFLAFIQKFNTNVKLIVLDDVLTSIDAGHRMRVARMLAKEFRDSQMILTTHDELWANELDAVFRSAGIPFKEIRMNTWNPQDGATYDDYETGIDWEYYKTQVNGGRCQDAVAGVGRNLEKFFVAMRKNLKLAVPATPDDRYTLKLLYDPFFKWLKSNKILRPDLPDFSEILTDLNSELDDYWQFRNWSGAHFNEWGAKISPEEALRFIEIVQDLIQAFECPRCGSLVTYYEASKTKSLICPVCPTSVVGRVVWEYQPDWHRQTLRLLQDSEKQTVKLRGVVGKTQKAFDALLRDSRRRLCLAIPANSDDRYLLADLIEPFFLQLNTYPRPEIPEWHKQISQLQDRLRTYLTTNLTWLEFSLVENRSADLFDIVEQISSLVSCPACHTPLNLDTSNGYTCSHCQGNRGDKPAANWHVI